MSASGPDRFDPGATAVRRDIVHDKVRSAWPFRVVHDTEQELAFVCWSGAELLSETNNIAWHANGDPSARARGRSTLLSGEWELDTFVLEGAILGFQLPDVYFGVLLFYRPNGELSRWYVNFERPYRRTPIGVDTRDLTIDLVFEPDRAHRWKDVDEYEQFRRLGLIDDSDHAEIERAKEQAFAMFEQRTGPFDERWTHWRRDPDWPVPVLPDTTTTLPPAL